MRTEKKKTMAYIYIIVKENQALIEIILEKDQAVRNIEFNRNSYKHVKEEIHNPWIHFVFVKSRSSL